MPTLKINGQKITVNAEPNMPLLWVLRDKLKLKGTKFGCGKGLCGACTVHLNGKAIRSCSTPLAAAIDAEITTIEGLTTKFSPVQKIGNALITAWEEEKVPQCGYCQPGQIMNAAALIAEQNSLNAQQVKDGMSGNICRCGTYTRINNAVLRAAKEVQNV